MKFLESILKPTILMIPSWYPSTENPHNGSFFREQALALSVNFNFIVIKPKTIKELDFIYKIKSLIGYNKPQLDFIQNDEGIQEFAFHFKIPTPSTLGRVINLLNKMKAHLLSKLMYQHTKTTASCHPQIRFGKQLTINNARHYAIDYLKKQNLLPHFD